MLSDLLAARSQMAMSLAFHIIFAAVGMSMPLLMAIAEGRYLRTRNPLYLTLAQRWSQGTAILFAVGAVSGTVLSFELGLLWPRFMAFAGPIIGMPFSLEGFAFFLEAIFLGIYLYGWNRISPLAHWLSGVAVFVCGTASGALVLTANAWMNTPVGFTLQEGKLVHIDPWKAMWNPAAPTQMLHMTLAAYVSVAFAVAGIHAYKLLQEPHNLFHRKALEIALLVGAVVALLQPLSGDLSAQHVAEYQPVKLAAMEAHWETRAAAPLTIGGWPDEAARTTRFGLEVPYMLSVLAHHDPFATVTGLDQFPESDHPPIAPVHLAFQVMVGCGTAMMGVALFALVYRIRKGMWPLFPMFLRVLVVAAPLGFIATEAGWVVTEVGRQPWVVVGYIRTADAVTPMPGLVIPFLSFSLLYLMLAVVVVALLRRHVFASPVAVESK